MGGSIRRHPGTRPTTGGGGQTNDPFLDFLMRGHNPANLVPPDSDKAQAVLSDPDRQVEPGSPEGWQYVIESTSRRTAEVYLIVNNSEVYDCGTIRTGGGK